MAVEIELPLPDAPGSVLFLSFHGGVHHINMVADPATHSKKETFVAVLWSWEVETTAYGYFQLLHPGKIILPSEQDMPDSIALLARLRNVERVASYRQLQAVSNPIRLATGGRLALDTFQLPAGAHVRPVQPGEVRVVRRSDDRDIAWLVNRSAQTAVQVLPDGMEDLPLLALFSVFLLVRYVVVLLVRSVVVNIVRSASVLLVTFRTCHSWCLDWTKAPWGALAWHSQKTAWAPWCTPSGTNSTESSAITS